MNIITGINSTAEKGKGKRKRGNTLIVAAVILNLLFASCASKQQAKEEEVVVKTDVKVVSPTIGNAEHLIRCQAVTRYMQTNEIRNQLAGKVIQINCVVAGTIRTGQALFVIQPQEAAALKKSKFNNQFLNGLSDTIYSFLKGQVKNLNVQVGDFVQPGDILASCIRSNSMRIIAYIPVEQVPVIEKIKRCSILLPDGTSVEGTVSGQLPSAEAQNQTLSYLIEPKATINLSENINLTVEFTAEQLQDALFVPENAVLGNEEQTSFWVMKLLNDSICTKVQVEKGLKRDKMVQLIGSVLNVSDRVISEGAYGLADSARIHVLNNEAGETKKPTENMKTTGSRH